MAKAPKKDEDEEQSRRFIETAKALEADGEPSPIEANKRVDDALRRMARVPDNKQVRDPRDN